MPVIVCHALKGGAGTTFMAAHVAMALSESGAEVTMLTMARRDSLPLHFGLQPALTLPSLYAPTEDAVVAAGIDLRSHVRAAEDPDFIPSLRDLGFLETGMDRVLVMDVPAGDTTFARTVVPHSCAHLCVVNATPDTLALTPQALDEATPENLLRTSFVINALDETRRLSRHAAAFIRELVGPRLLGRVRLDESVPEAIASLQPLSRYAPSSAALSDARAVGAALLPMLDRPGKPWTARGPQSASSASRAA